MGSRCWAEALGGCADEMSKDHPVSAQLLPGGAIVEGFPWLGGKAKAVGVNSLGVRCLCRRHNSDLSVLDDVAGKLSQDLDALLRVSDARRRTAKHPPKSWSPHSWEEDGVAVERWCAKLMCTTLAGGLYGKLLPNWTPPLSLVLFAFGKQALGPTAGLFMQGRPPEPRSTDDMWGMTPVGTPGHIEGATIVFRTFRFCFLPFVDREQAPRWIRAGDLDEELMHHPRAFHMGDCNLAIRFAWKTA